MQLHKQRQRGTVMFEALLILPFIIMIVMLLLYLGAGSMRVQKAKVLPRYEAWRQAEKAPGPYADDTTGNTLIDQTFYNETSTSLGYTHNNGFPQEAPNQLTALATNNHSLIAGQLVARAHEHFPRGKQVGFSTHYHHDPRGIFAYFDGPISYRYRRIGIDWKYSNDWIFRNDEWQHNTHDGPFMLPHVRELYLKRFDDSIGIVAANGNPMARTLRNLYRYQFDYKGPNVEFRARN